MATEPLPDPCSWPVGDCCFTDEMQRLRVEVDAFREDAANYYRVAKEADAQQATLRARVAELEKALGELVRLKALKDRRYAFGDANITAEEIAEVNAQLEEYYLNRDAAWDAARAAMRLSGNKEGTPK